MKQTAGLNKYGNNAVLLHILIFIFNYVLQVLTYSNVIIIQKVDVA